MVANSYLDLEGEVFVEVFDDHDEIRKLYAECLLGVGRTCNVGCAAVTDT